MSIGLSRPLTSPPQQNRLQTAMLPAPTRGIDARLNLAESDIRNCVYTYNILPSEQGMQTRWGYREWVTNLETAPGTGTGVRTLIPFESEDAATPSKLFACTNEGIWDVTSSTDAPTIAYSFVLNSVDSGYGEYIQHTNDAGNDLIFYTDEANGLLTYTPGTDTWAPEAGITGIAATDLVFVVSHKQRLWFVERNTTTGWYLAAGAITGAATPFYFGGKFRHGGDLVGLYNWTLDSGAGVDDLIVAVSREGDVLPYQGDDPSTAATWASVGTFYIGKVPKGRRIATEYGGDMRVLSEFGLSSMSDILTGVARTEDAQNLNLKIARFLRETVRQYSHLYGFELKMNPNEGQLIVNTPRRANNTHLQYVASFPVDAWGYWRKVPANTMELWKGSMAFGTVDDEVMLMDDDFDGTLLDGTPGEQVGFSLLQAFSQAGAPAHFKYGEFARADFLSKDLVSQKHKFLYDYDIITKCGAIPVRLRNRGALWGDVAEPDPDEGYWDQDVWAGEGVGSQYQLQGSWGTGRAMALALCGTCYARTLLISTDVMWRTAGPF